MNRAIYIFMAIVLVVALGWVNVYDYIPDGAYGLYRINRITNQVGYTNANASGWEMVEGVVDDEIDYAAIAKKYGGSVMVDSQNQTMECAK